MIYISVDNETLIYTCFYRSPSPDHGVIYNFCSELNFVPTNINNTKPVCSTLLGNFNAKFSKLYSSDNNNIASIDNIASINNISTAAGCNQVINKPVHFINKIYSCFDLFLFTNMRVIKKYGIRKIITTLHMVLSNCNYIQTRNYFVKNCSTILASLGK